MNAEGNITSWLNELAFVPVDYNPGAPRDEWSGDYGVGVAVFLAAGVGRLLAGRRHRSGPKTAIAGEKLKHVQKLMAQGDERARKNLPDHRRVSRLCHRALCRIL